jgi:hypothetical protein
LRRFDGSELVIATHNSGKAREISDLLKPYIEKFHTATELDLPEPEETERTFTGNAAIKAVAAAKVSGMPALADDSGLAVTGAQRRAGDFFSALGTQQGFQYRDGGSEQAAWEKRRPLGSVYLCAGDCMAGRACGEFRGADRWEPDLAAAW